MWRVLCCAQGPVYDGPYLNHRPDAGVYGPLQKVGQNGTRRPAQPKYRNYRLGSAGSS